MRARFALLVILCGLAAAVSTPSSAEPFGQVTEQRGSVTGFRDGAPFALHVGAHLEVGDRIVTAAQSRLRVVLPDGSTFSIGAETDLVLTALRKGERGVVSLFIGILRSSLAPEREGGFEVRTPSAVASVRSTDWIVEALADKSAVFVAAGRVAVTDENGAGGVLLDRGYGTDVPGEGLPSAPKQWGSSRVEDFVSRTALP